MLRSDKYLIFNAYVGSSDSDSRHCDYDCDSETSIYKIPKNLLNCTFNEFRRDVYLRTQSWCRDNAKQIKMYIENKNELKLKNKELRDEFCKTPKICFTKILKKYLNYNKWLSFPQKLQIEIINARYIGVHDGNECSLVAEDNDHYYYAIAQGS
jgi:hypothetical protein